MWEEKDFIDEPIQKILNKIEDIDLDLDMATFLHYRKKRKKGKKGRKTERLNFNNPLEAEIIKNRQERLLEKMQALNRK